MAKKLSLTKTFSRQQTELMLKYRNKVSIPSIVVYYMFEIRERLYVYFVLHIALSVRPYMTSQAINSFACYYFHT